MVYYSPATYNDLVELFDGLLNWKTNNGQIWLEYETALSYFNDVKAAFDSIDQLSYHHRAAYQQHQHYGEYV